MEMLLRLTCALLSSALVSAAAFPWALSEPTIHVPAVDAWSPAPTAATHLLGQGLFRRQQSPNDNTCAFISGLSQSPITCQKSAICATNTYLGLHGCCDPASLSACNMPTTCIPSTAMLASCTDAACSSNTAVAKCTAAGLNECYQYLIQYSDTIMTQHGCTSSAFILTVQRSWGPIKSTSEDAPATITITKNPTPTPTFSQEAPPSTAAQPNLGIIVGCIIGGCTFFSIIALVAFLVHRRRILAKDTYSSFKPPQHDSLAHAHSTTHYNSLSSPSGCSEADSKQWQQQSPLCTNPHYEPVLYPGMSRERVGVVEVEGTQRPVEAPGWSGDEK